MCVVVSVSVRNLGSDSAMKLTKSLSYPNLQDYQVKRGRENYAPHPIVLVRSMGKYNRNYRGEEEKQKYVTPLSVFLQEPRNK